MNFLTDPGPDLLVKCDCVSTSYVVNSGKEVLIVFYFWKCTVILLLSESVLLFVQSTVIFCVENYVSVVYF